jgi:hypothetical protein
MVEAEANSLVNLGQHYTHSREVEKSLAALRDAETIFERDEWNRWRFERIRFQAAAAEHWLVRGDVDRAEEFARRALANANHHGVPKYVAVGHRLLGDLAIARGDLAVGDAQFVAAVDALQDHPAPLVAWKIYAALGRVRSRMGLTGPAHEAFVRASATVHAIADSVRDERLRATFLESAAVGEVLARSHTT